MQRKFTLDTHFLSPQYELIRKNILYSFGLDSDGEEIGQVILNKYDLDCASLMNVEKQNSQSQVLKEDGDQLQFKSSIKQAIGIFVHLFLLCILHSNVH